MAQHAHGDDDKTAFPASESTPGQAESRQARRAFLDKSKKCPWLQEYLQLRLEGWDWRKAAYIAWAASPIKGRWPENQQNLAEEILGLHSDRTIRTWREKNPEIDERVARLQVEPLMQHRRDVVMALIDSAKKIGKSGAPDRRTYFTLTGDLKPGKGGQDNDRKGRSTDSPYAGMNEEELELVIRNLQAAVAAGDFGSEGETDAGNDADDADSTDSEP